MTILVFAVCGLILVISMVSPRWGGYLLWTAMYLYPTSLMHGKLPLDVRFTDLFIVFLGLACLRVLPPDVLSSRSFRMAALWYGAVLIANLVGFATGPSYMYASATKQVARCLYAPLIVLILNTVIQSHAECRRQLWALYIGALAAIGLAFVQIKRPELVSIFEIPSETIRLTASERVGQDLSETLRASGGLSPSALGLLCGTISVVALRILVNASGFVPRLAHGLIAFAALLGIGYTVTRGAILGLMVALLYGIVFLPRRTLMVIGMVTALTVMVAKTDVADRLSKRVSSTEGAGLSTSFETRLAIWKTFLREPSPHYFLFGRGAIPEFVRIQGSAHSMYIGALSYTGLFGIGVLAWVIIKAWRMGLQLSRSDPDPFTRGMGEGLAMCLLMSLVHGISSDLWSSAEVPIWALIAMVDWRLRSIERGDDAMMLGDGYSPLGADGSSGSGRPGHAGVMRFSRDNRARGGVPFCAQPVAVRADKELRVRLTDPPVALE